MAAVCAMIQVLPEGRHSVAGAAWRTPVSQPQSFAGGSEAPRMGLVSYRKTRGWELPLLRTGTGLLAEKTLRGHTWMSKVPLAP